MRTKALAIVAGLGLLGLVLLKTGVPAIVSGARVRHLDRADRCHPRLLAFLAWVELTKPLTFRLVVCPSGGVREPKDIAFEYAKGRTIPGPKAGEPGFPPLGLKVTNVKTVWEAPHASRGGFAWAIDIAKDTLTAAGWGPDYEDRGAFDQIAAAVRRFESEVPGPKLTWGSGWNDLPHWEVDGWRSVPPDGAVGVA